MCDEYIEKYYQEVEEALEGEHKIILEPGRKFKEEWIEYDTVKWELEVPIQKLVDKLKNEKNLSIEEKILEIYKLICLNYIYDDNVLFFFRTDMSDIDNIKYIAVDWYGRVIDEKWKANREKHNRRVCYEFARFYAKAINELLTEDDKLEAFMLGDKENTHYVVGLTGEKYSVILDVDDFNRIKDITRLKLGLTIEGIKILRDDLKIFEKAVEKFNEGKLNDLAEVEKIRNELREKDTILYFEKVVEILRKYKLDSQGFMEYIRTIVENEGIEIERIWKEIKGDGEKRHVRCILFKFNGQTYLIDSVEQKLSIETEDSLKKQGFIFNPEENEYQYFGG